MSQYYNSYPGNFNQGIGQETTPGLKALQNSFGSVVYLIACIAFSLSLIFAFIELFVPSVSSLGGIINLIQSYAYQYGLDMPDMSELAAIGTGSIVGGIIGMIPTILICLGMWLIFVSAKKATVPASTAGYSILQVMNIISVVLMCLSTLLIVIVGIIGLVAVGRYSSYYSYFGYSGPSPTLILAIVLLLGILIMVFAIIYYVKVAAVYGISKDILRYNRSSRKVSMFVIVINFIGIFFSIISLIVSLTGLSALAMYGIGFAHNWVSTLSSLLSIVVSLFTTLTFIKARSEFSALSQQGGASYQSYNYETGAYNTGSYNTGAYQNFNTGAYQTQNYQQPNTFQQFQQPQQPAYQDPYQQQPYAQNPDPFQAQPYGQDAYQQPYQQDAYQQPYGQDAYQQPYQQDAYQQNNPYQNQQ